MDERPTGVSPVLSFQRPSNFPKHVYDTYLRPCTPSPLRAIRGVGQHTHCRTRGYFRSLGPTRGTSGPYTRGTSHVDFRYTPTSNYEEQTPFPYLRTRTIGREEMGTNDLAHYLLKSKEKHPLTTRWVSGIRAATSHVAAGGGYHLQNCHKH